MLKHVESYYSYQELSAFCFQISLLLSAAVPLDEGLSILAEDAGNKQEKEMLLYVSERLEIGELFSEVLEETGMFPLYVVRMVKLGQQTGTLDQVMEALSGYYDKEHRLLKNIRNALTYPAIMLVMLLVVLVILFLKVMPIFEEVYEQLGTQISPIAVLAIRIGGMFSVSTLALVGMIVTVAAVIYGASRLGKRFVFVEAMLERVKRNSKIALFVANRRFTSVLATTLKSGMELERGLLLAGELVENSRVSEQIERCNKALEEGASYSDALRNTGLFRGIHIQMIKVGSRSGHLDLIMEEISEAYELEADVSIDRMLSRFEPTVVAVLAVAVGMILLSVMLPLAGILASIG